MSWSWQCLIRMVGAKSSYHKGSIERVSRMPIQEVAGEPEEKGPLKKAQASETLQTIDRQEATRKAIT